MVVRVESSRIFNRADKRRKRSATVRYWPLGAQKSGNGDRLFVATVGGVQCTLRAYRGFESHPVRGEGVIPLAVYQK